MNDKKFMTMFEAANYVGMSQSTLYQATHKKLIPHYKPSGMKVVFLRDDLDAWVTKNRIEANN